ncbi:TPA: hypothetical protein ACH3X1_010120 [Trebouxia sp. C0004]
MVRQSRFRQLVIKYRQPDTGDCFRSGIVEDAKAALAEADKELLKQEPKKSQSVSDISPVVAQTQRSTQCMMAPEEIQGVRDRLADMLAITCHHSSNKQIVSSICKPTNACKPLLYDEDVHPFALMAFSQAPPPPQALGGLQELLRVPSIVAEGCFKAILMSVPLATPGGTPVNAKDRNVGNSAAPPDAPSKLLRMMQQPNRYDGIGSRAKADRPEQGDELAQRRVERQAKQKAPSSAAAVRKGSKASSLAHQPNAQAGRSRKDTTQVARTRGQRAGKNGANKKAEEASGSEPDNVDDLESYSSQ